jgi:hypothetical protein
MSARISGVLVNSAAVLLSFCTHHKMECYHYMIEHGWDVCFGHLAANCTVCPGFQQRLYYGRVTPLGCQYESRPAILINTLKFAHELYAEAPMRPHMTPCTKHSVNA